MSKTKPTRYFYPESLQLLLATFSSGAGFVRLACIEACSRPAFPY